MGPTHRADADSDSREYIPTADSPFYRFSTPPFRLSFHLCFRVVPVVCVFVPCGILRGSCSSDWSRERSAPSSVARVCRLTPPYTRTTLCRLSVSLITGTGYDYLIIFRHPRHRTGVHTDANSTSSRTNPGTTHYHNLSVVKVVCSCGVHGAKQPRPLKP